MTNKTEFAEEEILYRNVLEQLKLLKTSNDNDEKIKYLGYIKATYRKELKIPKKTKYERYNVDQNILITEGLINKYLIKLHKKQSPWYYKNLHMHLVNIFAYIGFGMTIICFPITIGSVHTVKKEFKKQWEMTNKNNLISRYNDLLKKSSEYKENENISVVDFKSLMTYIKESDSFFITEQKQKYKKLYKEKFESEYKDICSLGYPYSYVHIKKDEFVNCLKYMKILQEN